MTWPKILQFIVLVNFSSKTPGARRVTGARDKPLRHVHSSRKHHDEEVASSQKKKRIQDKSAKIDTLFITKMAEKPNPLGPHIPI